VEVEITMKTEQEVRELIRKLERDYEHVLTGTAATLRINAPRALMQIEAEAQIKTLYWILGEKYESKLNGVD
jgi:hypothetical protein